MFNVTKRRIELKGKNCNFKFINVFVVVYKLPINSRCVLLRLCNAVIG